VGVIISVIGTLVAIVGIETGTFRFLGYYANGDFNVRRFTFQLTN
jgi:hypothetical protein